MSHNPTRLKVLFFGNTYRAYELPLRYLPWLMGITLTEVVWPLFFSGLAVALLRFFKKNLAWQTLGIILFWLGFILAYVLVMRPPMYDGYRHFLFILPPVFILAGFAFDALFNWLKNNALNAILLAAMISPAIFAIYQLHPYEYTYYNSFVGGPGGAAKIYETDYWLTCYKDAVEAFNRIAAPEATLIVKREAANAAYYARNDLTVSEFQSLKPGDFLLLSARLNDTYRTEKNAPAIITIQRDGALFCVIKQVK
ncbi:MAG: hypothetical protein L3J16_06515, partial [Anaerolineales bacterium]|nr:hypothetical protein [Anaerolineales bacterium]